MNVYRRWRLAFFILWVSLGAVSLTGFLWVLASGPT